MVAALSLPVRVVQAKQTAQRLYESLGWSIIPVDCSVTEIVDGRRVHRKPALIPWKRFTTRRADEQEIAEWRRRFPNAGIAVICGAVSNLLVLDADGAAGVAEAKRRGLPKTPMVSTPSGGLHAYFRAVPGQSFRNGAKLGSSKKLDVRSDAGYVVAPYSTRSDGKRYEWLERPDQTPLAEPPGWFLELLQTAAATNPLRAPLSGTEAPSGVRLVSAERVRQGGTGGGSFGPWLAKLSTRVQQLIFDPPAKGGRSEADFEVVTALICVGAPFTVVEGIFKSHPIGEKYLEAGNGTRYLEMTAQRAFRNVKSVRVKYADLKEYDSGGKRVHLALDIEGEGHFIRTGITVPDGRPEIGVRWQHLFEACGARVPGVTRDELEKGVRSLRDKRMRVLLSTSDFRNNPVVSFHAI